MHGVKIDDLTVKIKLSGERQGITSGRIKTVADEFREDIDIGATREKMVLRTFLWDFSLAGVEYRHE